VDLAALHIDAAELRAALLPAVGPGRAFAELFAMPLRGGVLTDSNATLVAWGSSRYDVFPNLHVLITLILLDHDRRFAPRRFALCCCLRWGC
jgi:hypothetical protein